MPILTFLLAAAFAAGCTFNDESTDGPKRIELAAGQEMENYVFERRAEFIATMTRELDGIQNELDLLVAKVDRSSGEAKAAARQKLEAVREKWGQAKKQLRQAEEATSSTWDDVKHGVEELNGELKDSFDEARQWLSDKIEP